MKLNFNHSEFLDFVIIMLYNTLKDDDFMNVNPRYNELKEKMKLRGFKSAFFEYFLESSGEAKRDFKKFKPILKSKNMKTGTIFLYPSFDELVKEVAEIITGKEINESKVQKIIEKLRED